MIECRGKCPPLIHECWTYKIFYRTMSNVRRLFRFLFWWNWLVNSVVIFLFQTTLLRWLTFLLWYLTLTTTVCLSWNYFFLMTLTFVLQWLSLDWEILIKLLFQFLLTFLQTLPLFITSLWLFLRWLGWPLWSFERYSKER